MKQEKPYRLDIYSEKLRSRRPMQGDKFGQRLLGSPNVDASGTPMSSGLTDVYNILKHYVAEEYLEKLGLTPTGGSEKPKEHAVDPKWLLQPPLESVAEEDKPIILSMLELWEEFGWGRLDIAVVNRRRREFGFSETTSDAIAERRERHLEEWFVSQNGGRVEHQATGNLTIPDVMKLANVILEIEQSK